MIACLRCGGTGQVFTGEDARAVRRASGLSLREVARRMRLDPSYISDLERDLRPWYYELEQRFRAALATHPFVNSV